MSGKTRNLVVEIVILSAALVALDLLFFPGCFRDWNPSPLWSLVVLVAMRYGSPAGIAAGAVAAALHLWEFIRGGHAFQELMHRNPGMLSMPVLFILVGMYIGESRERLAKRADHFRESMDALARELDANEIKRLNLERARVAMEKRIAGQPGAQAAIYDNLNRLGAVRGEKELWDEFVTIIRGEMRAEACGVWRLSPPELLAVSGAVPEKAPPLALLAVKTRSVATVADWSEHHADEPPGADLAALLVDDGERPLAVAVIGMGFGNLNRNAVILFELMVQRASLMVAEIRDLERLRQASVSDPELGLGSESYLRNRIREQILLVRRYAGCLSLVACRFGRRPAENLAARLEVIVACALRAALRASDGVAFFPECRAFVAMLPETGADGARVVMGKVVANIRMLDIRDAAGDPLLDVRLNAETLGEGMEEKELYEKLFAGVENGNA